MIIGPAGSPAIEHDCNFFFERFYSKKIGLQSKLVQIFHNIHKTKLGTTMTTDFQRISSHNGNRITGWFLAAIQGNNTNPVVGREDRFKEVEKGNDDSLNTGLLHEDHDEEDEADQAQDGCHDSGRNQELPGFLPLKGKEGKAESNGTEGG